MVGFGVRIVYHPLVAKRDIPHLDAPTARRIRLAIISKLGHSPATFGRQLRGTLKGYWKLRIGDWRVLYQIIDREVRIIYIGHRREIYQTAQKIIEARK